jgi:WD40 repeat protein
VERLAWSPDGTRVASASYDQTVQVWEAKTGRQILTYKGHVAPVWAVAWSLDGKRIVSGTGAAGIHGPVTSDNSVRVWDATTGQTLLTYSGLTGQAYALAWSHDGTRIAAGGDDHIVHVWDAATGRTLLQYRGHGDIVFGVSWSPDDSLVASASVDGTVQIWHPQI